MWFLYIYLTVGIIYSIYIYIFGEDEWYWIPFNAVLGPITLVILAIYTLFDKGRPLRL